jgi:catechol 2,3-dioxygenase-like lactoylglutathione lyase family enzyme
MSWVSGVEQGRAFPVLPCRDQDETAEFYGSLGFAVDFRKPEYLILRRGPFEIHFRTEPGLDPTAARAACWFSGGEAIRLFHESARLELPETGEPRREPGQLVDPDGNRLWFAEQPPVPSREALAKPADEDNQDDEEADIARCPRCGSEFQPHVTICIDCGAPTVPAFSSAPEPSLESWQEPTDEAPPDLLIPYFPCPDLDEGVSFYQQLDFEVDHRDPLRALISLGEVEIFLLKDAETDPSVPRAPAVDCCVLIEDAGRLYRESERWGLPSSGAPRLEPLRDEPWDLREYVVVDPYGNRLRIVQELPPRLGATDLAWPEKDLAVCPACGAEFRAGVIRCLDCGARTRPASSKSPAHPERNHEAPGSPLPEEAEGVPCYHGSEDSARAFAERLAVEGIRSRTDWGRISRRDGQPWLLVAPGDLDRAREILREATQEGAEESAQPFCPACGAEIPEGEVECPDCGLVMAGCPECGAAVSLDMERCGRCGAALD